jgi:opacity protein-like surface antigen
MRRLVVAIAMVAAASTAAHAQAEWQVKAFIGPLFAASTTINDLDEATGKSHATYGASFTELWEVLGLEAEIARTPGFFEREPTGRNVVLNSSLLTLTGSLVVALPRHIAGYGLRPYGTIGAGWLRVQYDDTFKVLTLSDTMAAVSFGGGVTGFLSRRIGVNWDLRRVQSVGGYSLQPTFLHADEQLSFWRATFAIAIR